MQQAVRSSLAAGVAVVGVGALAVSPVTPPMPDLKPAVQSASVELSALTNPIAEFGAIFATAFQDTVAIGQRLADKPAPILSQVVKNQLASAAALGTFVDTIGAGVGEALEDIPTQFQAALVKFADGDISGGLTLVEQALLGPIVNGVAYAALFNEDIWNGAVAALTQPITNIVNVVNLLKVDPLSGKPNFYDVLAPLLAPVQVITDATDAFGKAGDGIVAGLKAGNLETIANAVLHLGPALTEAVLIGNQAFAGSAAGLLGPQGIINGLITIRDLVARAITPAAPAAKLALSKVADPSLAAADSITLDVAPDTKAIEAPQALSTEAGAPVATLVSKQTLAKETVTAAPVAAGAEDEASAPADEAAPAAEPAAADDAAAAGEESAPAKSSTTDDKEVVKDGGKTTPAKTTTAKTKKPNPIKDLRNGIRGAIKDAGNGLKKALSGLSGKTAKPAKTTKTTKSDSSAKSGGSSEGGSSSGSSE